MNYSVGDEVVVKIQDDFLTYNDANNYDRKATFQIIAIYEGGYFLFIPCSYYLVAAEKLTEQKNRSYKIHPKYIDSNIHYVTEARIVELYYRRSGEVCSHCNEFIEYASKGDAETWLCYACKQNPYR